MKGCSLIGIMKRTTIHLMQVLLNRRRQIFRVRRKLLDGSQLTIMTMTARNVC